VVITDEKSGSNHAPSKLSETYVKGVDAQSRHVVRIVTRIVQDADGYLHLRIKIETGSEKYYFLNNVVGACLVAVCLSAGRVRASSARLTLKASMRRVDTLFAS
jgi:hypothetical protein